MRNPAVERLFVEPGLDWQGVSPRLITERRLPLLVVALAGVGLAVSGIAAVVRSGDAGIVLIVIGCLLLLFAGVSWFIFIPRQVRSWRYAEREQDLLVTHGRLRRELSVVPYGRMQVIEVTANPISHRLGIATVTLVTASATTDARIPGLPMEAAHELRDRLAAKGEALTAGL